MEDTLPTAFISSGSNFLGKRLEKELQEKGCRVSKNINETPSYLFLIENIDKKLLKISQDNLIKTQVVLPIGVNEEIKEEVRKIKNSNLEIIYLEESGDGISSEEVVEKLIRGMFSYGFGEKENILKIRREEKIQKWAPVEPILTEKPYRSATAKPEQDKVRKIQIKPVEPIRIQRKRDFSSTLKMTKKIGIFVLILLWILAMPFLSLLISGITLKKGFSDRSSFYFNVSKVFATFSKYTLLIGGGNKLAEGIINYDSVGEKLVLAVSQGTEIEKNIFGEKPYDLATKSHTLFLNLDSLYKQINFLRADARNPLYSKYFLPDNIDLDYIIKYVDSGRKIARELPSLLGETKPANYLVVLQDRNELKATGGKIIKLGIFTFYEGRLTSKNLFDPSTIDSQLKGEVAAPAALQKYLGIKNWNIATSNWDPDFPSTATKMEWFLEKEMGQSADGVIAVDSKRFFDFAPNDKKFTDDILLALNNKDIQVFSNNEDAESALVNGAPCFTSNCETLNFGITEDDFGGNAVNSFINRSVNFSIDRSQKEFKYNLIINYENLSNSENYRPYVRIETDPNSKFGNVIESINSLTETLLADTHEINGRTEAGVLVQIPAHEKVKLTFSWTKPTTVDFEKPGKIILDVKKQPGIEKVPMQIVFNGTTRYNTNLEYDENITTSW